MRVRHTMHVHAAYALRACSRCSRPSGKQKWMGKSKKSRPKLRMEPSVWTLFWCVPRHALCY